MASRKPDTCPVAPDSALWPLAVRAADAGDYRRVSRIFAAARHDGIAAEDASRWERLLIEAGDFAAVAQTSRLTVLEGEALAPLSGADADGAPGGSASSTQPESDDILDFEPGSRETIEPAAPQPVVAALLRWFGGRADIYARQWYDARRDRSGYWPVRQPLTAGVLELHLLGRVTVGQYVLHPDHGVSFAALDFDPTAAALEQLRLSNDSDGALGVQPLVDYVGRVRAVAERAGIAAIAEDTGGVGLHLWFCFTPRLPAERARALLRELLWRTGPQPPGVAVEVFPKQDRLSGKGLGNLIKLPLGVHQATQRPSRFLDAEMRPLEAAAVTRLRPCDPLAIDALLATRVVSLPVANAVDARPLAPPPPAPTAPTPRALAEALAAVPGGRVAAQAADRILAGCAVVRELARQALEEHALKPDAARALLYTIGLVGRDNERIEALFANAGVSRKELDRVRHGLQGPAGCKKLRERFPDLCRPNACPPAPPGGYASPALFALHAPPSHRRPAPPWPEVEEQVSGAGGQAAAVEEPLPGIESEATGATSAIERRLARIEAAIERLARDAEPR